MILAGGNGSGLVISGGLLAGNGAGTGGGAVALHSPAFMLSGVGVADNSAERGGGVHLATDFGASMNACAAFSGCNAPLNELNFTGYVAQATGPFHSSHKRIQQRCASRIVHLLEPGVEHINGHELRVLLNW